MNKKAIYWILGLSVAFLIFCGLAIGIGLLASDSLDLEGGFSGSNAIALIKVEGVIQPGDPPPGVFSSATGAFSDRIVKQLKRANDDDNVKAVVLRVNSPGGGVVASDEIYAQVVAMDKPVLVSMGTLAASGGYYISAPATEIWANRHTLTGSIGVITQFVNFEEFMEEYGIDSDVIKTGTNKDTGSPFRALRSDEKEIWQSIIDDSYDVFVQIIVDGRKLDEATVRELADGRVYTGNQALNLGLVDHLGNLDDVINRAAELVGIEGTPRIIEYDQNQSIFGPSLGALKPHSPAEVLQELLHLNASPTPMYLYTGQ